MLVEEVVDAIRARLNPSQLNYVSVYAGIEPEHEIWAHINQTSSRLVVIRDADQLTAWQNLLNWVDRLRYLPDVYLVFVSNSADFPTDTIDKRKVLKPYVAALRAPRGSLVRCTTPAEPDDVAWVQRRSQMDDNAARHLLDRAGGDLAIVAGVCQKLSLFPGSPSNASINMLCAERPSTDFVTHLLGQTKRKALLCIPDLPDNEAGKVIGLLDSRLDLLQTLFRAQLARQTLREIPDVNPYLARQFQPLARHYDPKTCGRRRRVLTFVDDAFRRGARIGVWESLVALW